jgi:hypothetical protein
MKRIFICLLFVWLYFPVFSQVFTYQYTYDASGNRLSRAVINMKSTGGESIFDQDTRSLRDDFEPREQLDDEISGMKVILYPNPTRGELVLQIMQLSSPATGSITVIDLNGKMIYQTLQIEEYNDIDLENIPAGEYILKLVMNQQEQVYKILKK